MPTKKNVLYEAMYSASLYTIKKEQDKYLAGTKSRPKKLKTGETFWATKNYNWYRLEKGGRVYYCPVTSMKTGNDTAREWVKSRNEETSQNKPRKRPRSTKAEKKPSRSKRGSKEDVKKTRDVSKAELEPQQEVCQSWWGIPNAIVGACQWLGLMSEAIGDESVDPNGKESREQTAGQSTQKSTPVEDTPCSKEHNAGKTRSEQSSPEKETSETKPYSRQTSLQSDISLNGTQTWKNDDGHTTAHNESAEMGQKDDAQSPCLSNTSQPKYRVGQVSSGGGRHVTKTKYTGTSDTRPRRSSITTPTTTRNSTATRHTTRTTSLPMVYAFQLENAEKKIKAAKDKLQSEVENHHKLYKEITDKYNKISDKYNKLVAQNRKLDYKELADKNNKLVAQNQKLDEKIRKLEHKFKSFVAESEAGLEENERMTNKLKELSEELSRENKRMKKELKNLSRETRTEKDLDGMKKQLEDAERQKKTAWDAYSRMEKELETVRKELSQMKIERYSTNQDRESLQCDFTKLQKDLETKKAVINNLLFNEGVYKQNIKCLKQEKETLNDQLKLHQDLEATEESNKAAAETRLQTELSSTKKFTKTQKEEIRGLKIQVRQWKVDNEQLAEDCEQLEKNNRQLEKKNEQLKNNNELSKTNTRQLTMKNTSLSQEVLQLNAVIQQKETVLSKLENEISKYEGASTDLTGTIQQLNRTVEKQRATLDNQASTIKRQEQKIQRQEKSSASLMSGLAKLLPSWPSPTDSADPVKRLRKELEAKIKKIKNTESDLKSAQGIIKNTESDLKSVQAELKKKTKQLETQTKQRKKDNERNGKKIKQLQTDKSNNGAAIMRLNLRFTESQNQLDEKIEMYNQLVRAKNQLNTKAQNELSRLNSEINTLKVNLQSSKVKEAQLDEQLTQSNNKLRELRVNARHATDKVKAAQLKLDRVKAIEETNAILKREIDVKDHELLGNRRTLKQLTDVIDRSKEPWYPFKEVKTSLKRLYVAGEELVMDCHDEKEELLFIGDAWIVVEKITKRFIRQIISGCANLVCQRFSIREQDMQVSPAEHVRECLKVSFRKQRNARTGDWIRILDALAAHPNHQAIDTSMMRPDQANAIQASRQAAAVPLFTLIKQGLEDEIGEQASYFMLDCGSGAMWIHMVEIVSMCALSESEGSEIRLHIPKVGDRVDKEEHDESQLAALLDETYTPRRNTGCITQVLWPGIKDGENSGFTATDEPLKPKVTTD